jgi:hypothetical protein
MMNKQVEAWVQAPGSPNLYWALTDLPAPFIDLRKPLQGERVWMEHFLPGLRQHLYDPSRPPLTAEQMRQAVRKIAAAGEGSDPGGAAFLLAAAKYPAAKRYLAGRGWTSAQIEAMPALQAVFLQELFEYERHFDQMAKAANLPFPQGHPVMRQAEAELQKAVHGGPKPGPILARLLLPAVDKSFVARARLDRQIAALRAVEAIRLHAAAHGGRLPESLDAVKAVPVPDDPATGRPFGYSAAGGTATLTAPPLVGGAAALGAQVRYEITPDR